MREHIPKRHLDFENPIVNKKFDDTTSRIYGEKMPTLMQATSHAWGTGRNPAEQIPRVGLKSQNFEKEIAAQVAAEIQAKQEEQERVRQQRHFDTWNRSEFTQKDLTANVIGKKVMRTQDGGELTMDNRDDQLRVETGMWRRTQKAADAELQQRVPQGDYTKTTPVTIYTEALERKNFYGSAATGQNPFGVTRGFTQPVQATKAVNGYEGNVDFAR